MKKFVSLSDVYSSGIPQPQQPTKPFKTLAETYNVSAPVPTRRLLVYREDVELVAQDTDTRDMEEYTVEKEWWDNVISHYLSIQKDNPSIGSDIQKLFNICKDKKIINAKPTDKYVMYLEYLTTIIDYIYSISKDTDAFFEKMQSNQITNAFINFLNTNVNRKANLLDWLSSTYGADFYKDLESSIAYIWQTLRPITNNITRGYSGPGEVPLMLFCGGNKAPVGDIDLNGSLLELKADRGRIGGYSTWSTNRPQITNFINKFAGNAPAAEKPKGKIIEQQVRNQMDTIEDTVVDSPDSAALRAVGAQQSVIKIPQDIITSATQCIEQGIINSKQRAVMFIGICQLIDYAVNQNFKWISVFKHTKDSPKIPKMGALFTMSSAELVNTSSGLYSPEKIYKIITTLETNKIGFDAMYDKDGYAITFKAESRA